MKKYLTYFKVNVTIYFVYRLSFVLWRVRSVLGLIIIYFLWNSVYDFKPTVFSYSKDEILTYVLGINILTALILSSRTTDIAGEIVYGDIINYILKPAPFFPMIITKELADKLVNGVFAILEVVFFVWLLKPNIIIQNDITVWFFILAALFIGGTIAFFLSLSLSFAAFWTPETWAPRFIYFVLISLLAGTMFPLDILPKQIYTIFLFTPFPYLMYLPMKIYLTGLSSSIFAMLGVGIIWAVFFYFLARIIWNRGLKEFSFYGR